MLERINYLAAGALWDVVYRQNSDHLPTLSAVSLFEEMFADGKYEEMIARDAENGSDSHDYVMTRLHSRMNEVLYEANRNTDISGDRSLRLAGHNLPQSQPGYAIYKIRNAAGDLGHLRFHCSSKGFNFRLKVYQDRPTPGQTTRPIYTIDSEISSFDRPFNTVSYDEDDVEAWADELAEMLEALLPYAQPPHLKGLLRNAIAYLDDLEDEGAFA